MNLLKHQLMTVFCAVGLGFVAPSQATSIVPTAAKASQSQSFSGAYAMPDDFSAQVVKEVLQRGGNAVDAAVAAAFVLAVTYPEAGNLGGGGFMTLAIKEQNAPVKALFLDYRETAPAKASRDMYLDDSGQVVPFKSLIGAQASGVPGTVMGMWQAHQRFGSKPWYELLQPAIKFAEQGFIVPQKLQTTREWFQGWVANKSEAPLNFNSYFAELKAGERFVQPELAQTLKRIANKGADEFYRGQTARQLVQFYQKVGGLISEQDLASYQAKWREPVRFDWRGKTLISAPPPSSGGIAIAQLLGMEQLLWDSYQQRLQTLNSDAEREALRVHFYAEMMKRVYADRAHYLGDSDFVAVPIEPLKSQSYLQKRAKEVNLSEISKTSAVKYGAIESPETTHFSIVDAQGSAVSNTYTLNMPFGNGMVIEGAGFLMNNEMDDFSTKPGVANIFGVVGGTANEIAPHKRMLSSMSPTIVLKNNDVDMVVGTPGGSTIITSVFQTIMNVYQFGMDAQQAVDAPRVHHQLLPKDRISYNPSLDSEVKAELELMGYEPKQHNYMGDVQLLWRAKEGWQVGVDERGRGDGAALVRVQP